MNMSDKSKLIHELEWALTLVKYSPNPNYDKVAEHFNNAQQQLKILNRPVVTVAERTVCPACYGKGYEDGGGDYADETCMLCKGKGYTER